LLSCSAASKAAPAPLEMLDAIVMVFLGDSAIRWLLLSLASVPYFSFST
jgi:hypothetical protein